MPADRDVARLFIISKDENMNWDRIDGNWKQLHGSVRAQWGKLTADHLQVLAGQRDRLAGRIQARRGRAQDASTQGALNCASSTATGASEHPTAGGAFPS